MASSPGDAIAPGWSPPWGQATLSWPQVPPRLALLVAPCNSELTPACHIRCNKCRPNTELRWGGICYILCDRLALTRNRMVASERRGPAPGDGAGSASWPRLPPPWFSLRSFLSIAYPPRPQQPDCLPPPPLCPNRPEPVKMASPRPSLHRKVRSAQNSASQNVAPSGRHFPQGERPRQKSATFPYFFEKKGVQKNFVPAELIRSAGQNPQYRAENTVIDSARRALSVGEVSAKKEPIRPGKLHFEEGALKRVGKSCKAQTVVSTPSKQFFPSLFLKTSSTTLLANAFSWAWACQSTRLAKPDAPAKTSKCVKICYAGFFNCYTLSDRPVWPVR